MRIAMLVFNDCRNDARVRREARTLAEAGHDVRVLARMSEDADASEQVDGFRIIRVSRYEPLESSAPLYHARRMFHRGAGLARFYRRCVMHAHREPADVYHAHDFYTLPGALAARRLTGGKLVYDAHELYPEGAGLTGLERRIIGDLEGRLVGGADAVITVGDLIADELTSRYGIRRPIVLRNCPRRYGVSGRPEQDPLRSRLDLDPSVPIVLYQGGFRLDRGLPSLVRAARHLDHGVVVLLGWGPLEDSLKTLAAREGLQHEVFFLPAVPPEELPAYTACASVGVVPIVGSALSYRLCSPNKLYEYIGAGIPVVASDLPELRKVVREYRLGELCDPEDPASIAACIDTLLSDDARYATARAGARRAADRFNWERESKKLLALYEGLDG